MLYDKSWLKSNISQVMRKSFKKSNPSNIGFYQFASTFCVKLSGEAWRLMDLKKSVTAEYICKKNFQY